MELGNYTKIVDVLKMQGIDYTAAAVVITYTGFNGVQRWLLYTEDGDWVLLFDMLKASPTEILTGGGPTSIFMASSPLFLLKMDNGFDLLEHADLYDQVRARFTESDAKDGGPFFTVATLAPQQAALILMVAQGLRWEAFDASFDPFGKTGSAVTLYADPDGVWSLKE